MYYHNVYPFAIHVIIPGIDTFLYPQCQERERESCKERTSDVNNNPCVSMPLYICIYFKHVPILSVIRISFYS